MKNLLILRPGKSFSKKHLKVRFSIRTFRLLIFILAISYHGDINSININNRYSLSNLGREHLIYNISDSSKIKSWYGNSVISLHTLSLSSINRGAFSYGITYNFELKTDNQETIFKVFGAKNDLSVEIVNSNNSKIHYGICNTILLYGFGFRHKNGSRRDITFGCDLHFSPIQSKSYSILPKIGIMNYGIWDLTYSYNIKSEGIYCGYSPHNIGIIYRLGLLIKGLGSK